MTGGKPRSSALAGWRVLIPRTGPWGERARALLADRGAIAVVADLLSVGPPPDAGAVDAALGRLANGRYDWLMITSATAADALQEHRATIPPTTRVAAVGEATADALRENGVDVAFTPGMESSGPGLAESWQSQHGRLGACRVLLPRSTLARPELPALLAAWGHKVDAVAAYSVATVAPAANVVADAREGRLDGLFITSGSVARAVADHLAPLHPRVAAISIGPVTTSEAGARGLGVERTAARRSLEALVEALEAVAADASTLSWGTR